jgi:hypothetical protein
MTFCRGDNLLYWLMARLFSFAAFFIIRARNVGGFEGNGALLRRKDPDLRLHGGLDVRTGDSSSNGRARARGSYSSSTGIAKGVEADSEGGG